MKKLIFFFSMISMVLFTNCSTNEPVLDKIIDQINGQAPVVNGTLLNGGYIQSNGLLFPKTAIVGDTFSWTTSFFSVEDPVQTIEVYVINGSDTLLVNSVPYSNPPVGFSLLTQTDTLVQSITILPEYVGSKTAIMSSVSTEKFTRMSKVVTLNISN